MVTTAPLGVFDGPRLGRGFCHDGLARLLFRGRDRGAAAPLQLLDLRPVGRQIDPGRVAEDAIPEPCLHHLELGRTHAERREVLADGQAEGVEGLVRLALRLRGGGHGGGQDEKGEEKRNQQQAAHGCSFHEPLRRPYSGGGAVTAM
jgi:hypothetical protein